MGGGGRRNPGRGEKRRDLARRREQERGRGSNRAWEEWKHNGGLVRATVLGIPVQSNCMHEVPVMYYYKKTILSCTILDVYVPLLAD